MACPTYTDVLNVFPDTAILRGSIQSFDGGTREKAIVEPTAASHDAAVTLKFDEVP
jgi:hypothetical protein